MLKIFHVDGDPLAARSLAAVLAGEYVLVHHPDPRSALAELPKEEPAAILYDLDGGRRAGLEDLALLAGSRSGPPVIALGSDPRPREIVKAVRLGAADYLAKPLELAELKSALRNAIRPPVPSPFIGESKATKAAAALVHRYAGFDYPVLILGESGCGKEIAARALHSYSRRTAAPFVARNCAAFPEELIESELFGSAKGAFTGAVERPGAFELAQGGTLFLDEIGEAGPPIQSKLLRVLESGDLWRLGDNRSRKADIRLISATSCNLKEAVAAGRFRADLLYRIDTLVLEIPPLRERKEDIPHLAEHFVLMACGARKALSASAYERLASLDWPGNVRELKNVLHRAIVLSGELEEIGEEHIVVY